jgi:hypothetical protein
MSHEENCPSEAFDAVLELLSVVVEAVIEREFSKIDSPGELLRQEAIVALLLNQVIHKVAGHRRNQLGFGTEETLGSAT